MKTPPYKKPTSAISLMILLFVITCFKQLSALDAPLKLFVGQHKELIFSGVKSISVGNSRFVEVKKFPISNQILVYAILPGQTNIIIKFKDSRPPLLLEVKVSDYQSNDASDDLSKILNESRVRTYALRDSVVVQGFIDDKKNHLLLTRLKTIQSLVLNYQFSEKLCQTIIQELHQTLADAAIKTITITQKPFCAITLAGNIWQKSKLLSIVKDFQTAYPPLSIQDRTQANISPTALIETKILLLQHSSGTVLNRGLEQAANFQASLGGSSPLQIFSILDANIKMMLAEGTGKAIYEPILLSQNGETATFKSQITTVFEPTIGLEIAITPQIIGNKIITSAIGIQISTPTSPHTVHNNKYQGTLTLKGEKSLIISKLTQAHVREHDYLPPFFSDLPIIGVWFRYKKKDADSKALSLIISQKILD